MAVVTKVVMHRVTLVFSGYEQDKMKVWGELQGYTYHETIERMFAYGLNHLIEDDESEG